MIPQKGKSLVLHFSKTAETVGDVEAAKATKATKVVEEDAEVRVVYEEATNRSMHLDFKFDNNHSNEDSYQSIDNPENS